MEFLLIILNIFFVSFTDKPVQENLALSPRAIEQREKWNIEFDEMDYPVHAVYLDSLRAVGVKIHHTSRWFNGATCEMEDDLAEEVSTWTFVKNVELTRDGSTSNPFFQPKRLLERESTQQIVSAAAYVTDNQLNLYNLKPLHNAGYYGQGILMTICDGGFYNANTLSCFRQSELELGHFDFTDDVDGFYGSTGTHGTECLSSISGILENYQGAATQAKYYLMRSEENNTESPKEMDNLVAALEKSDSLGVNVFSVSLGYSEFDNSSWSIKKTTLDGKTHRASIAATIAARKGMLVCVAAGNEGDKTWKTISVPADADSILTVGAVSVNGTIAVFSSYGPSADGRVKPEVCAVGYQTALIDPNNNVVKSNGTSFATPLIAGMAATLWSALPSENAMQIRARIIVSADRYDNPDFRRYGYGIPDAWKAYTMYAESCESVRDEENTKAQKILHNGQIRIVRGGRIYTITGQLVE